MAGQRPEDLFFCFNGGTEYHGGAWRVARRFHGKTGFFFLLLGRIPLGLF